MTKITTVDSPLFTLVFCNFLQVPAAHQKVTKKIPAYLALLENFVQQNKKLFPIPNWIQKTEFSVNLCGDKRIQSLNNNYRHKNKVTDVLSFPVYDSIRQKRELHQLLKGQPLLSLGDIFICSAKTASQAKEFGISYEEEFFHLLTHGFLHLCGYDHEISPKEEKIMFSLEEKIMNLMYIMLAVPHQSSKGNAKGKKRGRIAKN